MKNYEIEKDEVILFERDKKELFLSMMLSFDNSNILYFIYIFIIYIITMNKPQNQIHSTQVNELSRFGHSVTLCI